MLAMGRTEAVLSLLLITFYGVSEGQYSNTCPFLAAPDHGRISRCTNNEKHLSVCTTVCQNGYELHGSSRILCWCGGGYCGWRGIKPSCKAKCETPDFDGGRVRFVDQWPGGFAGVIELSRIPDLETKLTTGWSIALIFDQPLGQHSTVSCWNAKIISASADGRAFTLVNGDHNSNLANYLHTPTIRWAFIAEGVGDIMPEAAYVAMYNKQISDASCLQPRNMPEIQTVHIPVEDTQEEKELEHPARFSTIEESTSSAATTTTKPSTQPTTLPSKIPTTASTTTPITTAPPTTTTPTTIATSPTTIKTTPPTTTTTPTTTPATTTPPTTPKTTTTTTTTTTTKPTTTTQPPTTTPKTTIPPPKPKKRRPRRRRKRIKKTTTTTTTTTWLPPTSPGKELFNFVDETLDVPTPSTGDNATGVVMDKAGERYCILQTDDGHYVTQEGWEDGGVPFFSGNAILTVKEHLLDWTMLMIFDSAIDDLQVWSCTIIDKSSDGRMWTFGPHSWNLDLYTGKSDINFIAKQAARTPSTPIAKVYLCSYAFLEGDAIVVSPNSEAQEAHARGDPPATHPPLEEDGEAEQGNEQNQHVDVEGEAKGFKRWQKPKRVSKRCQPNAPNGIVPKKQGQIVLNFKPNDDGTKYNYNEILHKSILFYETQRAGRLPRNNRIPWRGDSTLKDGCDIGVDLSGGWFDAGDHVKFHFPMSCTVALLSWGGILFRDAYQDAGELARLQDSIKWPVEYLIKAHISKYEFVGQVGSGKIDHVTYGRPEEMRMPRPTYIIDPENPGTELAAEAAAAFAAAHEFYKKSHPRLARTCLKHAKEMFDFADKFRGDYHNSIPDVQDFYFSYSGYNDELIWGAAWLYKVTGDTKYLLKAKGIYLELGGQYAIESEFSWDRKLIAAQILLANITGDDIYRIPVQIFLKNLLSAKATPKGLFWVRKWGPNRYAANVAFLVMAASTLTPPIPDIDIYVEWAQKQIHLLLGDIGRSYVVGIGKSYPVRVHHRSSACKPFPAPCTRNTFYTNNPNYYILHGGLVGGPDQQEKYTDDRKHYEQTEVACDYNAGFQGAVAGGNEEEKALDDKFAEQLEEVVRLRRDPELDSCQ